MPERPDHSAQSVPTQCYKVKDWAHSSEYLEDVPCFYDSLIPSWVAVLFFVDKYKPARYRYKTHQQVRQSKTCYSGIPPYDHPVYKTTSLLRPYSFKPNVKTIESFYYFEDPVNATTSLLRPGFYGPTVVALTGFHCRKAKAIKLWSSVQIMRGPTPIDW